MEGFIDKGSHITLHQTKETTLLQRRYSSRLMVMGSANPVTYFITQKLPPVRIMEQPLESTTEVQIWGNNPTGWGTILQDAVYIPNQHVLQYSQYINTWVQEPDRSPDQVHLSSLLATYLENVCILPLYITLGFVGLEISLLRRVMFSLGDIARVHWTSSVIARVTLGFSHQQTRS